MTQQIQIAKYDPAARVRAKAQQFMIATPRYPIPVEAVDFGDEGIGLMSCGTMIKDHYSEAESAEIDRLNAMDPVKDGDTVQDQNGILYTVKINGHYSDAGMLIKQGGAA